jgi:hypothetical protein
LFSPRGATTFLNVRKDRTGEPLLHLDQDEVKTLVLDFTDYLDPGETVSSATATAESVTCTPTTSSPTVSLALSAAASPDLGQVTVIVTFSSGNKWRGIIRVRRTDRFTDEALVSDYA